MTTETEATEHSVSVSAPANKYVPYDYRYHPDAVKMSPHPSNIEKVIEYLNKGVAVYSDDTGARRILHVTATERAEGGKRIFELYSCPDMLVGSTSLYDATGSYVRQSGLIRISPHELLLGNVDGQEAHCLYINGSGRPRITKNGNSSIVTWEPDVLTSPSGKKFRLTVDDSGTLGTVEVT